MSDSMTLTTGSGRPYEEIFIEISGFVSPTKEDRRLAGEIVRAGIRERTARGIDADGSPFAPYNETRPYTYSPTPAHGKAQGRFGEPLRRFSARAEKAAATRLLGKLRKAGTAEGVTKTGKSLRFASYGAFKRAFGRANVDLFGVSSGPHMLNSIVVTPVEEGVTIGIYDPRSRTLAAGHTTGNRPRGMPLRRFFGVGSEDIEKIKTLLQERILTRIQGRLK